MAETVIDVVRILSPRSIVMNAIAGTAHTVARAKRGPFGAIIGGSAGAVAAGVGSGVLAAFIQSVGQRQCVPSFLDRHYIAFARPQE